MFDGYSARLQLPVGPIQDIGEVAGLGAFLGCIVLSVLCFLQAREVRQLKEWAGRAPERDTEAIEATSGLAAERAEEMRRQLGEGDLRSQSRVQRAKDRIGLGGGRPLSRLGYVLTALVAVILIGTVVAATQLISGANNDSGKGTMRTPSQTQVDVLNATFPPVSGLAGSISNKLKSSGYGAGSVRDSNESFTASVVMFKSGFRREALIVARKLGVHTARRLSRVIRHDSGTKDPIVVVVGEDKANSAA